MSESCDFYSIYGYNELYHHGILGQKWGVRRYQNEDGTYTEAGLKRRDKQIRRISTMYDYSNKWTTRKIGKLEKKGKMNKAAVMKVMKNKNEAARKQKVNALKNMSYKDLKDSKSQDIKDALFGGQMFMKENRANMTTFVSRLNEYEMQRGQRWASNFTLNSTLGRMSPEEGYDYLRKKDLYYSGYAAGRNSSSSR